MQTTYAQKNDNVARTNGIGAASVEDHSEQASSLQRKMDLINSAAQRMTTPVPVQRAENPPPRPNNTGLPDDLKNGVESLSGYSLDNVRVHYNSPKPATVQALAYTQGNDIHVAPGQEHALPHEAWHVTQQMAGRVSPTKNIGGMPVNDNESLEHEADVMGEKAVQCKEIGGRNVAQKQNDVNIKQNVAQRVIIAHYKNVALNKREKESFMFLRNLRKFYSSYLEGKVEDFYFDSEDGWSRLDNLLRTYGNYYDDVCIANCLSLSDIDEQVEKIKKARDGKEAWDKEWNRINAIKDDTERNTELKKLECPNPKIGGDHYFNDLNTDVFTLCKLSDAGPRFEQERTKYRADSLINYKNHEDENSVRYAFAKNKFVQIYGYCAKEMSDNPSEYEKRKSRYPEFFEKLLNELFESAVDKEVEKLFDKTKIENAFNPIKEELLIEICKNLDCSDECKNFLNNR